MNGILSSAWMPVVAALVGGALGAFGGNWFQARLRHGEAMASWFEKYCVTECVEPLIAYLNLLGVHLASGVKMYSTPDVHLPGMPELPVVAEQRLLQITGTERAPFIFHVMRKIVDHGVPLEEALGVGIIIDSINASLIELQAILMDTRISRKSEFFVLHKRPRIREIAGLLDAGALSLKEFAERNKILILPEVAPRISVPSPDISQAVSSVLNRQNSIRRLYTQGKWNGFVLTILAVAALLGHLRPHLFRLPRPIPLIVVGIFACWTAWTWFLVVSLARNRAKTLPASEDSDVTK